MVPTVSWPGLLAPFRLPFFDKGASTALRRSHEVCGVRTSKMNDRSGRTVTRQGVGVPVMMCAVRALNSYSQVSTLSNRVPSHALTLQKSIDLTPLEPKAGPTGGLGLACPAPTISFTIWSTPPAPRALDMTAVVLELDESRDAIVRMVFCELEKFRSHFGSSIH